MVELWTDNSLPSAMVDLIPLGTLYGNLYYAHSLRMEVDNNVSRYNSLWMCVISVNKEIIFILREIVCKVD